ncbi:hypothetical protein Aglo03_54150 [Actinokineospora globicatena]|uniref:Uncharacterized protein n=1 Tax=Actinokineospora globicatena TaxID=103729 RepID=A0A9W6QU29_9PSEU|nr:hypothetical protein Aglo03_54150 [Actinokineospora globicatena]
MHLEADREPVRGRPRQAGLHAQLRQAARLFGDRLQYRHRLVQNSDAAMLSHVSILLSRYVGSPVRGKQW